MIDTCMAVWNQCHRRYGGKLWLIGFLMGVSFSLLLMTLGMASRNYVLHTASHVTMPYSKRSVVTATASVGHERRGTATPTPDDKQSYPVVPSSTGPGENQEATPASATGQATGVPDGTMPMPTQMSAAPTSPPQPSPTTDSVPIITPTAVPITGLTPTPTAMPIVTPTAVPIVEPTTTPTEDFSYSGYNRYSH